MTGSAPTQRGGSCEIPAILGRAKRTPTATGCPPRRASLTAANRRKPRSGDATEKGEGNTYTSPAYHQGRVVVRLRYVAIGQAILADGSIPSRLILWATVGAAVRRCGWWSRHLAHAKFPDKRQGVLWDLRCVYRGAAMSPTFFEVCNGLCIVDTDRNQPDLCAACPG